jgi:hypothetical protein
MEFPMALTRLFSALVIVLAWVPAGAQEPDLRQLFNTPSLEAARQLARAQDLEQARQFEQALAAADAALKADPACQAATFAAPWFSTT